MSVARLNHTRHNENAPTVGSGWGAETEPSGGLAMQLSNLTGSFCIAVAPRQRSCAMSMHPIFPQQAAGPCAPRQDCPVDPAAADAWLPGAVGELDGAVPGHQQQ